MEYGLRILKNLEMKFIANNYTVLHWVGLLLCDHRWFTIAGHEIRLLYRAYFLNGTNSRPINLVKNWAYSEIVLISKNTLGEECFLRKCFSSIEQCVNMSQRVALDKQFDNEE